MPMSVTMSMTMSVIMTVQMVMFMCVVRRHDRIKAFLPLA
jgi:hypothetical protein